MMATRTTWEKIPNIELGKTPEDIISTADRCAIIAKRAVVAGYDEDSDEPATLIADVIADLRHLCDAIGVDFFECYETVAEHYAAEINENEEAE